MSVASTVGIIVFLRGEKKKSWRRVMGTRDGVLFFFTRALVDAVPGAASGVHLLVRSLMIVCPLAYYR